MAHPYANQRIGLATMHAKERALGPPFRRVLGAEIVVPALDTDTLGTFSGEVPRPDALVETALLKAEMLFEAMPDLECALASEGSYGPIDRVPLNPGGVELLAFVDRKRGIRHVETLPTHRTSWRLQRFAAGDPARLGTLKAMGFPAFGVFVVCSSDMSQPIKGLATVDAVIDAMDREARRSADGLAVLYSDMRAHKNPLRMKVLRAAGWKLAKRLATLCPRCHAPGWGWIDSRRGLPCEACAEPTHWIDFEIDGCPACGHAASRPRKDGRRTASRLSCRVCR
ncbi:hypothetical protein BH10PSE6_BH10PSE6_11590 [soil metagenome]